eukprot:scaffold2557_cov363-Pavlova_lutheri.AAC.4
MCTALQVIAKYQPSSEAETFDIMNILEEPLASVNSAVLLAAAKVVLCITKNLPHVLHQVLQRIKTPLLIIATGGPPAAQYIALCHVHQLCVLQPVLLSQDFTRLFCRDTDPTYIKLKKMTVLVAIADEQNVYDIVSELNAYILDTKHVVAVAAVTAIGQIALRNFNATGIVERLLEYIVEGRNHVVSAAVVCVREVFRKYPGAVAGCTEELKSLDCHALDTVEAQAAGLWIMGEYSEHFDAVVDVLESYVERLDHNLDPRLKCELLIATLKLFYKNPPRYSSILQRLIKGTIDNINPIVKDRALLYYRLLHQPMSSGYEVSIIKIVEQSDPGDPPSESIGEDQEWLNSLQVVSSPVAQRAVYKQGVKRAPFEAPAYEYRRQPSVQSKKARESKWGRHPGRTSELVIFCFHVTSLGRAIVFLAQMQRQEYQTFHFYCSSGVLHASPCQTDRISSRELEASKAALLDKAASCGFHGESTPDLLRQQSYA